MIELPSKARDITGHRFGRLIAVKPVAEDKWKQIIWLCQCDCGKTKEIRGKHLWSNKINSCGCFRIEIGSIRNTKHGHAKKDRVTRTFHSWQGILARCLNKNSSRYSDYGGRGITVCERWLKFENFLADMGECPDGLSIDRINNGGNYELGNCRWSTPKEQSRNKRSNHIIEYDGQKKPLCVWAELFGISQDLLGSRISNGWDIHRALVTP